MEVRRSEGLPAIVVSLIIAKLTIPVRLTRKLSRQKWTDITAYETVRPVTKSNNFVGWASIWSPRQATCWSGRTSTSASP